MTQVRGAEDAGHTSYNTDGYDGDLTSPGSQNHVGWYSECGDPDPTQPDAPHMLYYNQTVFSTSFHNGPTTFRVTLECTTYHYDDATGDTSEDSQTATQTLTPYLLNTTIADDLDAPYLRWDPETMTTTTLGASMDHASLGLCGVRYEIFGEYSSRSITRDFFDVPYPGHHSGDWDGHGWGNGQGDDVAPRGLYPYRIEASDSVQLWASATDRSDHLRIEQVQAKYIAYDLESGVAALRVRYLLRDNDAIPAEIVWVDNYTGFTPATWAQNIIEVLHTVNGPLVTNRDDNPNPTWNTLDMLVPIGQRPEKIVLSAQDGGPNRYRDHVGPWAVSEVIPTVVPGFGSHASLHLYKYTHDANGNEIVADEINTTAPTAPKIGGKLCVELQVTVDKHNRVAQAANSVTLRLQELPDTANLTEQHPFSQNHADKVIPYANTAQYHWEKYCQPENEPLDWHPTSDTPRTANDSEYPMRYRLRFAWQTTQPTTSDPAPGGSPDPGGYPGGGDPPPGGYPGGDTTSVLLGHNGRHTVNMVQVNAQDGIAITFEVQNADGGWDYTPPFMYADGPGARSVAVGNLVLENAKATIGSNSDGSATYSNDYLAFDPDAVDPVLANPIIYFDVRDDGDPHQFRYEVSLWNTSADVTNPQEAANPDAVIAGGTEGTGAVAILWDGKDGNGNAVSSGTYSFEISIEEVDDLGIPNPTVLDQQKLRSLYNLQIPGNYVDPVTGEHDGHSFSIDFDDEADAFTANASYYLTDLEHTDASEAAIDVLDPYLQRKAAVSGDTHIEQLHEYGGLYTLGDDDPGGDWRGIFRGADGHGSEYRDHQNRRMLAINQVARGHNVYIEDDWIQDPNLGELNPLIRTHAMTGAFGRAGWKVNHAGNNTRMVNPAECGVMYYYAGHPLERHPLFLSYFPDDNTCQNISDQYFHYKGMPYYIHALGATYFDHEIVPGQPPGNIVSGRSVPDNGSRWSYSFLKAMMSGDAAYRRQINIIHEIGHQFLGPVHHHNHANLADSNGNLIDTMTDEERNAYDESNVTALAEFRARPLPGAGPGRDSFTLCVFEPSQAIPTDDIFCLYHALGRKLPNGTRVGGINHYQWP